MGHKTALYDEHQRLDARIVPFGGWDMPLHYGSQIEEHHAVRRAAGMFDVSHMRVVDIEGAQAGAFLRHLLANDVAKLDTDGKALYTCMLNANGGVIDDLIVYLRGPGRYRAVVNAATAEKDIAWLERHAESMDTRVQPRTDLAMIAVQGPKARGLAGPCLPSSLQERAAAIKPFHAVEDGDWFVGRTGYTGEDGFEVVCPAGDAPAFWRALESAGVAPCGLGARDTLRLEAGLNLYGQDMDETITPLESGLEWTVAWEPGDRDFIGRDALVAQRDRGATPRFVGLLLEGRGVLRAHQAVTVDGTQVGELTSGGFGPTLERSIGFARVAADTPDRCAVDIRGKPVPARVVALPFVRKGKIRVDL